jgi:hypothetical protein
MEKYLFIYVFYFFLFFSNMIIMSRFWIPFMSICIPFLFNLNSIVDFCFVEFYSILFYSNPCIWIQFKVHSCIQTEVNFHKINSFFHQLFSWSLLVVSVTYSPSLDSYITPFFVCKCFDCIDVVVNYHKLYSSLHTINFNKFSQITQSHMWHIVSANGHLKQI